MRQKWLAVDKSCGKPAYKRVGAPGEDAVRRQCAHLEASGDGVPEGGDAVLDAAAVKVLLKRQLASKARLVSYRISKGAQYTADPVVPESDLTPALLQGDAWRGKTFKKFLLEAEPAIPAGALHPLLKVRSEFRNIFLEMGFQEMPTAQYVESSFWNFDALFQPQQHPARDAHDTFFMKQPARAEPFTEEYMSKVQEMHERGGAGSIGYRYDWSRDEAAKNLLRTHATAVSTRMLYRLAQQTPFRPVKYFSIDRVFRNETLDATHLAEFHQVEGVVADYNLTLANLIGILNLFFTKLGMKDLKFKPAYNPYTEPSMEIFAYHPDLKKEVEIGNSGVFRPEMLVPMGLPEDVTVIAWGLSVERPTMIKYGYSNIRDLFGACVDLRLVADNPICRI